MQHTKEESFAGAAIDEVLVWGPKNLHDTRQLLLFVFTREDGEASVQLSKDATQAPHINGHVIVHAKDDLRGTVEATLNIRVDYRKIRERSIQSITTHSFHVQSSCCQSL